MESPPSKPPAHGFSISHASPVPTTLSVPNTPASSNSRMDLLFAAGELLSPNGSNCDGGGENKTELIAMDATTISAQEENAKQIPLVPMCVSQDSDVKQPLLAISRTAETSLLPTTTKEPRRHLIKQKRGPGRPRKHPLPESNVENSLSVPPKKRGQGRPRKNPVPDALGQTVTKTGPARPRKQGTETAKRGPGRPRKQRGPGRPRKHPLPLKRGPGRPRKHPSPKKHELPVFGPARRVGRPFKVPVLVSEFLPPEQEKEQKPQGEAEPEKPVVRKLTRKGRPQKIPLHLNDMVHCVGKKPTCNWMKLTPGDILKQQSSLRTSTSSSHARADLEFTSVEERVMDDGSMLPKRDPKKNPDGTYIRPVGRAPPGTIWEKYRGLWVPYSNLKYGEYTFAPNKNQTPDSVSESNVKGSSLSECAVEQEGIGSSHETTRVEDENAGS